MKNYIWHHRFEVSLSCSLPALTVLDSYEYKAYHPTGNTPRSVLPDVLQYDRLADKGIKVRFATYKSLLFQIREKLLFNALDIRKPRDLSGDRI